MNKTLCPPVTNRQSINGNGKYKDTKQVEINDAMCQPQLHNHSRPSYNILRYGISYGWAPNEAMLHDWESFVTNPHCDHSTTIQGRSPICGPAKAGHKATIPKEEELSEEAPHTSDPYSNLSKEKGRNE
eukprot:Gb_11956 [translate_table: standard]